MLRNDINGSEMDKIGTASVPLAKPTYHGVAFVLYAA